MTSQSCLESDGGIPATPAVAAPQCPYPAQTQHPPAVRVQIRRRVLRAAKQGNYETAIALLNRLLTLHPDSAQDYSNRGLVYFWSGQSVQALTDFHQAIALDPTLASAYNNRANCYAAQGALALALADYERAIDLNPLCVRARINRAITLRELEHYRAALDELEMALTFHQLTAEIYAQRGRTHHLRGDWNGAVGDYHRALAAFAWVDTLAVSPQQQQVHTWLQQILMSVEHC